MDSIDVLNFGSLNIDHVYQVPHFVRPKEPRRPFRVRNMPGLPVGKV